MTRATVFQLVSHLGGEMSTTTVELTAGQLLNQVRGALDPGIGRSTVWRWRNELGLVEAPFTETHLTALTAYGRFKRFGCNSSVAKRKAAQWLQERGL